MFSNYFDILMLKIIFKKLKKYYFVYFQVKNILKNKLNHIFKYSLNF